MRRLQTMILPTLTATSNSKSSGTECEGKEQGRLVKPKQIKEKAKEQNFLNNSEPIEQENAESSTLTTNKSHLHNGKGPSGRGIISLAPVQVSAREVLTLQILNSDAQHGTAVEILQFTGGTMVYI